MSNLNYSKGILKIGNVEILIYNFRTQKFRKKFSEEINKHNVITGVAGLSEIFDDGSLFIEETQSGRLLFFDKNGKLVLEYVNKANNGMNYGLGFSKVLLMNKELKNVSRSELIKNFVITNPEYYIKEFKKIGSKPSYSFSFNFLIRSRFLLPELITRKSKNF